MENPVQYGVYVITLTYSIFDIYMVTYFGNEIKLASRQLSNCLYECNWVDQSKIFKRCLLIANEVLRKPQLLVIGKLYPLDLEVFSNVGNNFYLTSLVSISKLSLYFQILNFAYRLFNVLKNMKF